MSASCRRRLSSGHAGTTSIRLGRAYEGQHSRHRLPDVVTSLPHAIHDAVSIIHCPLPPNVGARRRRYACDPEPLFTTNRRGTEPPGGVSML
jgi:hypothetical protein